LTGYASRRCRELTPRLIGAEPHPVTSKERGIAVMRENGASL
jgi:hypothetical protein